MIHVIHTSIKQTLLRPKSVICPENKTIICTKSIFSKIAATHMKKRYFIIISLKNVFQNTEINMGKE